MLEDEFAGYDYGNFYGYPVKAVLALCALAVKNLWWWRIKYL